MDPTLVAGSIAQVDELDPVIAVVAWALTFAAGKWALPEKYRRAIPAVAVLIATALVASMQALNGEPLTAATLVRGVGAGAAAVAGHSAIREAQKAMVGGKEEEDTEEVEETAAEE